MSADEVFALIVWEHAQAYRAEILKDVERRFALLAAVDVAWSPDLFASNLARLYGDRLPSAAEKAERCGSGPFTLVVVGNRRPAYRLRRTRRRLERVNRDVFAARQRYRRLTRSHDLVHATLDDAEAARDLFLLTGQERETFLAGDPGPLPRDLLGTHGWDDEAQLVRALDLAGGCRPAADPWTYEVGDPWWAARLAFLSDDPPSTGPVVVGGSEVEVRLVPRPRGSRLPWRRFAPGGS